MKKLAINKATGIVNIVMSVISAVVPGILFIWGCSPATTGDQSAFESAVGLFCIVYLAALVLNIVALVKSRKAGIKIYGHICGVVAGGLYSLIGVFAGLPCLVLFIIASVGVMKQQPISNQQ